MKRYDERNAGSCDFLDFSFLKLLVYDSHSTDSTEAGLGVLSGMPSSAASSEFLAHPIFLLVLPLLTFFLDSPSK